MLILGHAGITLGATGLLNGTLSKRDLLTSEENKVEGCLRVSSELIPARNYTSGSRVSWLTSLGNRVDIRLLLIGSLLPDIIDKPVGQFFLRDTFSNGRIFCHTLLFLILITLAGLYLRHSRSKTWLLVLSFGTFAHLILDQMWLIPRTLLWPLYGVTFDKIELTHWLQNMLHALLTDPTVYIPEIIGGAILVWFAWVLVSNRNLYSFITKGRL